MKRAAALVLAAPFVVELGRIAWGAANSLFDAWFIEQIRKAWYIEHARTTGGFR